MIPPLGKNSLTFSDKTKPLIPLIGIHLKEVKVRKENSIRIFTRNLFEGLQNG